MTLLKNEFEWSELWIYCYRWQVRSVTNNNSFSLHPSDCQDRAYNGQSYCEGESWPRFHLLDSPPNGRLLIQCFDSSGTSPRLGLRALSSLIIIVAVLAITWKCLSSNFFFLDNFLLSPSQNWSLEWWFDVWSLKDKTAYPGVGVM